VRESVRQEKVAEIIVTARLRNGQNGKQGGTRREGGKAHRQNSELGPSSQFGEGMLAYLEPSASDRRKGEGDHHCSNGQTGLD
jgi:hypothetical protein